MQLTPQTSTNVSEEQFDWFLTNVISTTRLTQVIKMAENAYFSTAVNDECLPNFMIFGESELLEISNNLNDDEISQFIEENRNVRTTKNRQLISM